MKRIVKNVILPLIILMVVIGGLGAGWWWSATHTQVFAGMTRREGREAMRPFAEGGDVQFRPRPPEGFRDRAFDGDRGQVSLVRGLGGVIGTLVKLSFIVVVVLLIQRGLAVLRGWFARRNMPPAAPPDMSGQTAR